MAVSEIDNRLELLFKKEIPLNGELQHREVIEKVHNRSV